MKKKPLGLGLLIICCLSLVCLFGCHSKKQSHDKGVRIVTSFYPIYAMTKYVSGDLNDVRMIRSSAGIHSFEPSPNDVAAIYQADLFVYHSHTLESWAGDLDANSHHSDVKVLEAGKTLKLQRVAGLEDLKVDKGIDPATLSDPHTWSDPLLAADEADVIAAKLSQVDPEHKAIYQKNASRFRKEANKIYKDYKKKFKSVSSRTFVTQHTAFSYVAKRFGLTQLGIAGISPEQEPTARQLKETRDFINTYKVKTIFVESNVSPKIAQTVAKSTGAKLKMLSPLEADPKNNRTYLDNVKANLDILYQELK
ncbi:metal ABC transporter solute-binding protein, Zn/Mn family [Streptococcus jiangjianxini]|uniref:metal ABC transporter solute-binding protein, Zn/Mn family n=1 Tax=Streptococcus jiangjianxini TaxID=3161189 RepID=UPI00386A11C4